MFLLPLALALAGASVRAAGPATEPSEPPSGAANQPAPQYPINYHVPTAEEITNVLERVRERVIERTPHSTADARPEQDGAEPAPAAGEAAPAGGADRDKKFSELAYPMGVIHAGMLLAADATGDKKFADFTAQQFQYFADNLPKYAAMKNEKGSRNPFRSLLAPTSLDACGAMGSAIIKARRANVGPDLKSVIDRFAEYVTHKQLRLEDGTLCRNNPVKNSIWGDDMYMSVPLLAQMGALTGDRSYFDDACKQVLQMSGRLWVPSAGCFTHAWNTQNPDDHPHYYWGRANGWCLMAMAELLEVLPEDHPQREAVLKQFRAAAQGIATLQSGNGMWHQMLDRPDSYPETSCTAMFTFALARGVNRGWLDSSAYGPVAIAGWNGLMSQISADGHVDGTCIGTNYADDYVYYYHRPAMDDQHGYGPVLLAGAEMIKLVKNGHLRITAAKNRPIAVTQTK